MMFSFDSTAIHPMEWYNSIPGEISASVQARQLGSFYSQLQGIGASGGLLSSFCDGCLRGRSTERDLS